MSYGAVLGAMYTGGANPVRVLDASGASLANFGTNTVLGVAADPAYMYIADGWVLKKCDFSGNVQWSANHGETIRAVAVDGNGNVYIGGNRSSNLTHRKYSSSGALVWSKDHGDTVYAIAVDSTGNVYIGGWSVSGIAFRKYDSNGFIQWSKGYGGNSIYAVAVDSSGNCYAAGPRYNSKTHYKYNTNGVLQWSDDHGTTVTAIAADSAGDVVIGGGRTANLTHRKYSSSGALVWSKDHGAQVNAVTADPSGGIWIAGVSASGITHRRLDGAGNAVWSGSHGDTVYALAYYLESNARLSAGLPFPLALAVPLAACVAMPPSLPFAVAMAAPTSSPPPTPPEQATRYRLYITGQSSLLVWPMASFQCRRRRNDSTWLTVSITNYTVEMAAVLTPLIPINPHKTQLVIYAGTAEGQWGEMLRAWLTDAQITHSADRAELKLTGRIIPVAFSRQIRALAGVERIQRDEHGRRVVFCAVNPQVRPNDEVIYGASRFVVGTVKYRISPQSAEMEVTEDG